MSKSYFVLLSLKDSLVISHMASANEMLCSWGVSAWSQIKTGGRGIEAFNIQLYSINMVLSECGRTGFLFIAHKVGFACFSHSEVS